MFYRIILVLVSVVFCESLPVFADGVFNSVWVQIPDADNYKITMVNHAAGAYEQAVVATQQQVCDDKGRVIAQQYLVNCAELSDGCDGITTNPPTTVDFKIQQKTPQGDKDTSSIFSMMWLTFHRGVTTACSLLCSTDQPIFYVTLNGMKTYTNVSDYKKNSCSSSVKK